MTGKRVWWYFVTFFGFIAAVNAVMVTLAIRTHSGTVTEHPYEKGLAYNQVVKAKDAQDALGWSAKVSWTGGRLNVALRDKQNTELVPDTIRVKFTRPTESGMDFEVDLLQHGGHVDFPAKGVWDAQLYITCQGHEFQHSKRLVVE